MQLVLTMKPRNKGDKTSEYHAWRMMLYRCRNPKSKDWPYYGGRGITVCERWDSYENFLADMGRKSSPELELERKDNNKGYSPENCIWDTHKHQMSNRRELMGRYSKLLFSLDLPLSIKEACRTVGINYATFGFRVRRGGMSPMQALVTPVNKYTKKGHK